VNDIPTRLRAALEGSYELDRERGAGGMATVYLARDRKHDRRGDPDRAVEWYGRFVDLWSGADPELQPVVRDVQARIQRLTSEGRR
jgi:hypothetical protein